MRKATKQHEQHDFKFATVELLAYRNACRYRYIGSLNCIFVNTQEKGQ